MEERLKMVRHLVAQPLPTYDPEPGCIGEGLLVGNKYHAQDVDTLVRLGVTAVLNCAPMGVRGLPLEAYSANGIEYSFTNVAQDQLSYPILHDRDGTASEHLEVAQVVYERVRAAGGKVLFFCVAGQNRSAALAVAVLLFAGASLDEILHACAEERPFVLENEGFQRQLVELEALLVAHEGTAPARKRPRRKPSHVVRHRSLELAVELTVPGLRTFEVVIPMEATPVMVKQLMVQRVERHLLASEVPCRAGKSWLIFSLLNSDEFNLILEAEAVEASVQLARLQSSFGLHLVGDPESPDCRVRWTPASRFELVLFSTLRAGSLVHEPFTFRHQERPGAPGTLLAESLIEPRVRSWDFVTGEAFRSIEPIVFSFSTDPRSKRDFMNVSQSRQGELQQFDVHGEGGILGMGANAIVHHVQLEAARQNLDDASPSVPRVLRRQSRDSLSHERMWDAAVKRQFSLPKMLSAMENKAEAGVAKRLRMAGALNRNGRLLYFYGLGVTVASNNDNHDEYRFEATLLSHFQQEFSSYTLKSFLDDYTAVADHLDPDEPAEIKRIETLQAELTLIRVKVLLVSLLNGFRDLTLMGVMAFDFNHLNNVLISRDYRKARLIDIDGGSQGSIQFPSRYIEGGAQDEEDGNVDRLHKPALDVDLATLLPLVLQTLLFGKGRGKAYATDLLGRARRAATRSDDEAKEIIRGVLRENFFPELQLEHEQADGPADERHEQGRKHLDKVVQWFFATLMKRSPWTTWTNDIYDAMRCIDHLPIG